MNDAPHCSHALDDPFCGHLRPVRFLVVARPANGLQVADICSSRVIDSIKSILVVHVFRYRIAAYLTNRMRIAIHFTYFHPVPVIASLSTITPELLTLLASLTAPEYLW
jgi:hypothetical protein